MIPGTDFKQTILKNEIDQFLHYVHEVKVYFIYLNFWYYSKIPYTQYNGLLIFKLVLNILTIYSANFFFKINIECFTVWKNNKFQFFSYDGFFFKSIENDGFFLNVYTSSIECEFQKGYVFEINDLKSGCWKA